MVKLLNTFSQVPNIFSLSYGAKFQRYTHVYAVIYLDIAIYTYLVQKVFITFKRRYFLLYIQTNIGLKFQVHYVLQLTSVMFIFVRS